MSYCTVEDIRVEGVTEDQFDDAQLERLIAASCEFIDRVTGQWFELRDKTLRLDGRGGQNLVLPVFLYEADSVKICLDYVDDFVLYNRMEDRVYPKIFRSAGWPKGRLNIEVSGKWGYVEEDGTTPPEIRRAAMKLAIYHFPALSDAEAQQEKNQQGLLTSETTDGHSYALSNEAVSSLSSEAITGDTEIDRILKSYMHSRFRMAVA